jgi:Na+-transporting NADH:ubiquinone oxidoreductase subunit NqrB
MNPIKHLGRDPRHYQIVFLSLFALVGIFHLDFDIQLHSAALCLLGALLCQKSIDAYYQLPLNWKSALITSLSLILLLRGETWWFPLLAAGIAIFSKGIIRFRKQHLFNPANFAIVVCTLFSDSMWVSPGQWGQSMILIIAVSGLGLLVSFKATRIDISLYFLGCFGLLLFVRTLWLGNPISIPLHQLQNGALMLFTFFMISDPKSTPNHPLLRFIYALAVAILTYVFQFEFHLPHGIFYALIIVCACQPILYWLKPYTPYLWPQQKHIHLSHQGAKDV